MPRKQSVKETTVGLREGKAISLQQDLQTEIAPIIVIIPLTHPHLNLPGPSQARTKLEFYRGGLTKRATIESSLTRSIMIGFTNDTNGRK